jgi:hypothetical protein
VKLVSLHLRTDGPPYVLQADPRGAGERHCLREGQTASTRTTSDREARCILFTSSVSPTAGNEQRPKPEKQPDDKEDLADKQASLVHPSRITAKGLDDGDCKSA